MAADTLEYLPNTLICWLYSLKQWAISIEIPRQLSQNEESFHLTQKCYNYMKWTGVGLAVVVTFFMDLYRCKLVHDLANADVISKQQLTRDNNRAAYFVYAMVSLAIFSGLFLIDAMRRLQRSFEQNHTFRESRCKMILHILSLFVSQVLLITFTIVENNAVNHANTTQKATDKLDMAYALTTTLSQALFIYLLLQFSRPISQVKAYYESESSTDKSTSSLFQSKDAFPTFLVKNIDES